VLQPRVPESNPVLRKNAFHEKAGWGQVTPGENEHLGLLVNTLISKNLGGFTMKRVGTSLILTTFIVTLGLASTAWASDKEDVAATAAKWADAFRASTPDRIVALYDREAVLWGTLSPTRRDGPEAIRDYMVNAFKALPDHKVSFGDQLIRVYGNSAINTGYYTFTYNKDGESKSLPARYSFVYVKRNGQWMIVDHHSSAMPVPPK
jgi:uncharacterized protein (TIGR02246 family)